MHQAANVAIVALLKMRNETAEWRNKMQAAGERAYSYSVVHPSYGTIGASPRASR